MDEKEAAAILIQTLGDQHEQGSLVATWHRFKILGIDGLTDVEKESVTKFVHLQEPDAVNAVIFLRCVTIYLKLQDDLSHEFLEKLARFVGYLCQKEHQEKIWSMTEYAQEKFNAKLGNKERTAIFHSVTIQAISVIESLLRFLTLAEEHDWKYLAIQLEMQSKSPTELASKCANLAEEGFDTLPLKFIYPLLVIASAYLDKSWMQLLWTRFCTQILDLNEPRQTLLLKEPIELNNICPRKKHLYIPDCTVTYKDASQIITTVMEPEIISDEILVQLAKLDRDRIGLLKKKRWSRQCKWQRRRYLKAMQKDDEAQIGKICLEMLAAKNRLFEDDPSNVKIVQKMTFYAKNGIEAMKKAIELSQNGANFWTLAQLYSKFFSPSVNLQMEHTNKAIENYAKVIEINDNPELVVQSKDAKDLLERQQKTHLASSTK